MPSIHLDLTEIIHQPLRSGIQRVEREMLRHWDGALPTPCAVARDGRFVRLSPEVFDVLRGDGDGSPSQVTERARLTELLSASEPIADQEMTRLLNVELFFGSQRADAHLRAAKAGVRVAWYLYDFLPFLRPDLFPQGTTQNCMHFLRGLRSAGDRLAFLSAQTRDEFTTRVGRRASPADGWPVLCPGADGLQLERQVFHATRSYFVAFGTIEDRKNPDALLDAFAALWARGANLELFVAGRISLDARHALDFFERHAGNPRLTVLEQPSDEALRDLLRGARAVVMPSEAEGFGLPPYEAVYAGIPAIASAKLPSASHLPRGAMLLPRMDAASIAAAVEAMADDTVAAKLWEEAATVTLPSWKDFGRSMADWARSV